MRPSRIIASIALVAVIAGGATTGAVIGANRSGDFAKWSKDLQTTWDQDQQQGVPALLLDPLRTRLQKEAPTGSWWSPTWWSSTGWPLISDLRQKTDAAWSQAMAENRTSAKHALADWENFVQEGGKYVPQEMVQGAAGWPKQLDAASTPAQLQKLATTWQQELSKGQAAVAAAKKAELDAELSSVGGPQGLITKAQKLISIAKADNLDPGDAEGLVQQLQADLETDGDASDTAARLLLAVQSLQDLINLNDQIAGQVRPALWDIDAALAEGTPNAGALQSSWNGVNNDFRNGTTLAQLQDVLNRLQALKTQTQTELSTYACGHNVGSGKVITINLSLQEMVFYQDGCAVKATPVSTGRPQLRTPTGTFHIFDKQSPFIFHSAWPPSSPYWYPDSPVSWVMEFASGGYFIHDAPWESPGAYGPGSENSNYSASHGCVHTPTPVMAWAYSWTPYGTPVVISY